MKKKYTFVLLLATCVAFFSFPQLHAQVTIYSCGFDDAVNPSQWTMTSDAASSNGWYIGTATSRSGTKSLYVSNDNGTTAGYNKATSSIVMAYYTVTLQQGVEYAVAFDWKARGEQRVDQLSVCVLDNPADVVASVAGAAYPSWYATNVKDSISNSMMWQTRSFSVMGTGQPQRIVFVWKNDNNNVGSNSAGCVDNFYIREVSPLNYFCGFDDPVENSKWDIVNNPSCVNKWTIGSASYSVGPNALYISPDNGATASYQNREGWVTATREFVFPAGTQLDVSFDWTCLGEVGNDYFSVCWITDTTEVVGSNANSSMPSWAAQAIMASTYTADKKQFVRSTQWQTANFSLAGTGRPGRLVFIWKNNGSVDNQPGAIIDNLQITNKNSCPKPTDLAVSINGTTATLTWTGDSNVNYEVMYKNVYKNSNAQFTLLTNQTSPCNITNLTKGLYTFWVRAVCDSSATGQSSWAVVQNVLLITNDACVNFIDIHNPAIATATIGNFDNPYQTVQVIDNGQFAESSRHTVNTVQDFDERTGYGLRMIPDGELASIRLGNWDTGAQAESLTYGFRVDSSATILLLKYAVVLEDPGHAAAAQPKFELQILDANNHLIDPSCGYAKFISGNNTTGWHQATGNVLWKDWTLVGLNLQQYVGQNLKVRLTTYDCSQWGHYGYAYFTLDCAKGTLEGLSCGSNTADSICAPDGFTYKWYRITNMNTVISTSRCFTPPVGDTIPYLCKVEFKDKPECNYSLTAILTPRYPLANAKFHWNPTGCDNKVYFNSACQVVTSSGPLASERVDDVYWDFGNGTHSTADNPVVDYGPAGGQFHVMLVANMSNGECTDTAWFNIDVPAISPYIHQDVARICNGQTYRWRKHDYSETGVYTDSLKTFAGCDSILQLALQVSDLFEINDSAIICQGEQIAWNNRMLSETGFYSDTLRTVSGCDSVTNMNLTVNPVINIDWDQLPQICEDDPSFSVGYTNKGSIPTDYEIHFIGDAVAQGFQDQSGAVDDNSSITVPVPTGVRAGYYDAEVQFEDHKYNCDGKLFPMRFVVNYSKNVIKQLWNDVLGLRNAQYNGGYDFVSYQWYLNGSPISGANSANLYINHNSLDFAGYYQCKIVRSDGVELFTCPYRPLQLPDAINVTPIVIIRMNFVVKAPKAGNVQVFNPTGVMVMSYNINEGENELQAPSTEGIYLVRIKLNDGLQKTTRLIVVSQ